MGQQALALLVVACLACHAGRLGCLISRYSCSIGPLFGLVILAEPQAWLAG